MHEFTQSYARDRRALDLAVATKRIATASFSLVFASLVGLTVSGYVSLRDVS